MFEDEVVRQMTEKLEKAAGYAIARNVPGALAELAKQLPEIMQTGRPATLKMQLSIQLESATQGSCTAYIQDVSYSTRNVYRDKNFEPVEVDFDQPLLAFKDEDEDATAAKSDDDRHFAIPDAVAILCKASKRWGMGDVYYALSDREVMRWSAGKWDRRLVPDGAMEDVLSAADDGMNLVIGRNGALTGNTVQGLMSYGLIPNGDAKETSLSHPGALPLTGYYIDK